MVNITIPQEAMSDWLVRLTDGLFGKLGLPHFFFYLHSCYIYCFVILAVIALAAGLIWWKLHSDRTPTTRIQTPAADGQRKTVSSVQESGQPRILAAVHQHIGARSDQQDSYGVSDPDGYAQQGIVAVVADGMGGLANGRAVSSGLVRSFLDGFRKADPRQNAADLLLEQALRANAGVNQMLRGQDRSGSTLVSCVIREGYLHFLTVGDSRIYLCRGGALIQLNREHIYQEELAVRAVNQEAGLQQVRNDRQAHALTSYFGIGAIPAIDRNDEGLKLLSGDKLLLASDGVFGTLSQGQLEAALRQDVTEAVKTIGELIRQANRPHQDNNTAVVLEYRV